MPARTVALYSLKGSTGKTTLATATAAAVARAGAKVVLLDADKHGDSIRLASRWEGVTVAPWTPGRPVDGAHLVLIDCPPDRAAAACPLAEADLVVVPVLPEPLQVRRLAELLAELPSHSVVVVNGYYRGAVTDELVAEMDEMLGERLWRPWIPRRTAFPRSQGMAIPPQDFTGRNADVVEATSALAVKMLAWAAAN
jgi:cellulose biosynthesis protein BcsQ